MLPNRRADLRRALIAALSALLLLITGLPATGVERGMQAVGSPQAGPPQYGVKVELVSLFATVLDAQGKLVTGLAEEDFLVFEDGVQQKISQFSRDYVPLSVVILLDASSSMSGTKLEDAVKSLQEFLKRLNPGDEAMLTTFRTRPTVLQPFTRDLEKVREALKKLEAKGSTALYDTILAALEQTSVSRNRRHALLLLSDGINTYGKAHLEDTIERLRRQPAELFAIGVESNLPEDERNRKTTRAVLGRLTHSAGGEAFMVRNPRELHRICCTISDRMHNQYSLGYYPRKRHGSRWRSVTIETRGQGLRILPSKRGYYPEGSGH
jgi:VWFA-related protein